MKCIVMVAHHSIFPNPISFKKGDLLIVGEEDSEYTGWVRVTTPDGNQGWAPQQYLQPDHEFGEIPGRAYATHTYNALELDTTIGEELSLRLELKAWGWVENRQGQCGWVPIKTVQFV